MIEFYCFECDKKFRSLKSKGCDAIKCPKCNKAITVVSIKHPFANQLSSNQCSLKKNGGEK